MDENNNSQKNKSSGAPVVAAIFLIMLLGANADNPGGIIGILFLAAVVYLLVKGSSARAKQAAQQVAQRRSSQQQTAQRQPARPQSTQPRRTADRPAYVRQEPEFVKQHSIFANRDPAPEEPARPQAAQVRVYNDSIREENEARDKQRRLRQLDDFLKNGLIDKDEYQLLRRRYEK